VFKGGKGTFVNIGISIVYLQQLKLLVARIRRCNIHINSSTVEALALCRAQQMLLAACSYPCKVVSSQHRDAWRLTADSVATT
jgi:hypothetical protein